MTDVWRMDQFLYRHPPVDWLAAAWLKYEPKEAAGTPSFTSTREAARHNAEILAKMPARRNTKSLAQMPAFLRTKEQLDMIEGLRTACQTTS